MAKCPCPRLWTLPIVPACLVLACLLVAPPSAWATEGPASEGLVIGGDRAGFGHDIRLASAENQQLLPARTGEAPEVADTDEVTDQQILRGTSQSTDEPLTSQQLLRGSQDPAFAQDHDPYRSVDMASGFDLLRAVQTGLARNPSILAARYQLTSDGQGLRAALGDFGPKVNVNYSYTHLDEQPRTAAGVATGTRDSYQLNLEVTQDIFTGFRLLSTYQRAALTEDQSSARLDQAELDVILEVQVAFLDLLQARMDVKSREDSVARLESQLKVTRAFYDVGLRPRLDVLQAEVDLATAQQNLLTSRNEVAVQQTRLNTLLDLPVEAEVDYMGELEYLPLQRTLESCLRVAYTGRPDLRIGRKSVEIAREDVTIAASDFYPQVSASYDYFQNGDSPQVQGDPYNRTDYSSWQVGANARWNVFEWGATYYDYKSSKSTVARIESELARTRLDASFEVKSNYLDLREAADRIGVARKSVEAATEGYRMAVARYQAQVATITDVLDAQERLTQSESELIGALADHQQALARLYVSMGVRNPDLNPGS